MQKHKETIEIAGKTLTLKSDYYAERATASVLVQYGETSVLATVVCGGEREDIDYFPLYVEYIEKLYAGGIIKGSRFVKREGRPSDEAILTGRLVDRSIRPLFPKDYCQEVQLILTVLSVDSENDPDIVSMIAASACLHVSSIPWQGPIGAVRVALDDKGELAVNVSNGVRQASPLDLVLSSTSDSVIMLEAAARQVSEEIVSQAIVRGQKEAKKVIEVIEKLRKACGTEKSSYQSKGVDDKLAKDVAKQFQKKIRELIEKTEKGGTGSPDLGPLFEEAAESFDGENKKEVSQVIEEIFQDEVRTKILKTGIRLDGRKPDEIRKIDTEIALIPRVHGSGMFKRGQTQSLTIVTLGSPALEQLIEGMEGEETKRYIHHYNALPFSVGETGRIGWPRRREIGHGALAEKALLPVIPDEDKFPYTIRIVSEILCQNGSTSMAATCASTLALMDAGVPITTPVAGIAIGLMADKSTDQYRLLTDIAGVEDHGGDMDFKVAGTSKGVTAIQLDVKSRQIKPKILEEALLKAKAARTIVLEKIKQTIDSPRLQISEYAPKIAVLHIDPDKIGEVIGPGGRMIRRIIKETDTAIDVDDEGRVSITGVDKEKVGQAIAWIEGLTREVEVGETFEGTVKRLAPFGAFVEILPNRDGLVHVSEMSAEYVKDPAEILKIDQQVKVRVKEVDEKSGKVGLSMLFGEEAKKSRERKSQRDRRPPMQNKQGYVRRDPYARFKKD